MGCLLGCFGRRKNRRRQRRRESFQPRPNRISEVSTKDVPVKLRVPTVEEVTKSPPHDEFRVACVEEVPKISVIPTTDTISDKTDKPKEIHSPSPSLTRKRVTFDSNVKTYEHIVVEESIELFEEKKEEKVKPLKSCSSEGSDVTSNSSGSFPSNHRYQNCRESDDEEEEDVTDCDESDLEDLDDDDGELLDEDYYDNDDENYEDKLHNWDKEVYTEEIADNTLDIAATARDRSGYVNAVLNPIENLTQWKAVKSKGRRTQTYTQSRKEKATNLISDQEHMPTASFSLDEPKPKLRDETKKQRSQEVAVDASLSTWLSSSPTTTSGCSSSVETAMSEKKKKYTSNSSKPVQSYDERPILGALTSEEIKQFSATNSPRKSPSRRPESPIIGTVG
ncbi:hypothetical protein EUTSA_v10003310mg, partial [Eutrema salsugineum]